MSSVRSLEESEDDYVITSLPQRKNSRNLKQPFDETGNVPLPLESDSQSSKSVPESLHMQSHSFQEPIINTAKENDAEGTAVPVSVQSEMSFALACAEDNSHHGLCIAKQNVSIETCDTGDQNINTTTELQNIEYRSVSLLKKRFHNLPQSFPESTFDCSQEKDCGGTVLPNTEQLRLQCTSDLPRMNYTTTHALEQSHSSQPVRNECIHDQGVFVPISKQSGSTLDITAPQHHPTGIYQEPRLGRESTIEYFHDPGVYVPIPDKSTRRPYMNKPQHHQTEMSTKPKQARESIDAQVRYTGAIPKYQGRNVKIPFNSSKRYEEITMQQSEANNLTHSTVDVRDANNENMIKHSAYTRSDFYSDNLACWKNDNNHLRGEILPLKPVHQNKSEQAIKQTLSEHWPDTENAKRFVPCPRHPPKFKFGVNFNLPVDIKEPVNIKEITDTPDIGENLQITSTSVNDRMEDVLRSYKQNYWKIYTSITPPLFYVCFDRYGRLSFDILEFYAQNKLSVKKYFSCMDFLIALSDYTQKTMNLSLEQFRYLPFGSIISGLADGSSDFNITVGSQFIYESVPVGKEYLPYDQFKSHFNHHPNISNLKTENGTNKQIIKFTWQGKTKISVSITLNDCDGLSKTQSILLYAQCDWRFQPLYMTIKKWAETHFLIGQSENGLNSFSLLLMVIFFLQRGVVTPVLPVLEEHIPSYTLNYKSSLTRPIDLGKIWYFNFCSSNLMPLGELLKEFFHFYSQFNFAETVIKIDSIEHENRQDENQNVPIFIEDPFTKLNVMSPLSKSEFLKFIEAMSEAYDLLSQNFALRFLLKKKQ